MCLSAEVATGFLIANSILSAISFAACCITATIIAHKRRCRECPSRILLYITAVSLAWSIAAGLQVLPVETTATQVTLKTGLGWRDACTALGFLSNYFSLCKVFFAFAFCADVFAAKWWRKDLRTVRWEAAAFASSLVLPLVLFSWVPFVGNSYGLAGTWCSIKDSCSNVTSEGRYLGVGSSSAPNLALYGLSVVMILSVVTSACRHACCRPANQTAIEQLVTNFVTLLYPTLMCVAYSISVYVALNDDPLTETPAAGMMAAGAAAHLSNILLPVIACRSQSKSDFQMFQSNEYLSTDSFSFKESDLSTGYENRSLLVKKV